MIGVGQLSQISLSQRVALAAAHLMGWQVVIAGAVPPKCVIVGAHHTAAFDFVLTLICRMATGVPFRFVAKASLFRGPMGWVMRRLGGIPVERRTSQSFVAQTAAMFDQHETLMIAMSPEGTRDTTTYWRTGFYFTALTAGVPIVLAFADYRRKVVGLGPVFVPTGDIAADFDYLRTFYADVTARHPERQGLVQPRPDIEPQEMPDPESY